jgi:hypothetical protein
VELPAWHFRSPVPQRATFACVWRELDGSIVNATYTLVTMTLASRQMSIHSLLMLKLSESSCTSPSEGRDETT